MNAIEKQISTTYAPGILDELRTKVNNLKGKVSDKNWDRMHNMLRARSRFLARGPVEENLQPVANVAPAKVKRLGKNKRKVKWIQITRTDEKGRIWLDGWRRPGDSRKSHIRKMLREPRLLFDPAKVKKKKAKKKAAAAKSEESSTPSILQPVAKTSPLLS